MEELLELSRIDSKKQKINPTKVPIILFLRQLFSAYESKAAINQIEYTFQSELAADTHILVDKKHLVKIVNNLLSNALKFTPLGVNITFSINTRCTPGTNIANSRAHSLRKSSLSFWQNGRKKILIVEDKLQALRMGVDDYLLKPFSSDELLARTSNLIHNYQQRLTFLQNEKHPTAVTFEQTPGANEVWLKEIENHIKEALKKKLDLTSEYLASEMALSDRQLRRKLKSLTGLSTSQYIQEIKLQKARHLFENQTFNSIAEVAYAIGFNTPGY